MWGDEIGDSWGSNGLGLTGIGEGAGGKGEGIGIGSSAPSARHRHGLGAASATRSDETRRSHKTRVPQVRTGALSVSGHLPSEVVQRIVRQNYGRFRMCYEQGLGRNPNLQGRVAVRFVIGRDGAVSRAERGVTCPTAEW